MTTEMPQSDAAVRKATGKDWAEWKSLLDDWGAAEKAHKEIAAYLVSDHGVEDWWAQGVTVGYERAIGRRKTGQRNDGTYSASASKTINANAETVHLALVDDAKRSEWLGDGIVSFRTGSAPKSARFDDLEAGIIIAFFLTDKGEKTSLQVQGDRFASQSDADAWKSAWKPRLDDLARHLTS